MKPIDESWREALELLELPNNPGVFILGSFAEKVTVYHQQVRALNLVDALVGMGYLHQGSQVAIVGAGFAGTTAAAALVKIGATVSLFDSEPVPLHLQLNCATRYIHPHIYGWPLTNIEEIDAKLPILNWTAQPANFLAKEIHALWDKARAEGPGKVFECLGKEVTALELEGSHWRLKSGCPPEDKLHDTGFEVVILAVGFGLEKDDAHSYSYWGDIPLHDNVTGNHTWMISGAGDGALTDVMRLCIPNCDQEGALRKIISAVRRHAGEPFIEKLRDRIRAGESGTRLFRDLNAKPIAEELNTRKTTVLLNATEESIFGTPARRPRSSTLNRLVTWVMLESGKISLVDGRVPAAGGVTGQRKALTVKLEGGKTALVECQEFLQRHGPESVILPSTSKLDGHWLAKTYRRPLERLQKKWTRLYTDGGEDPTLTTDWSVNTFEHSRLSPDIGQQPAALLYARDVVGDADDELALRYTIEAVLRRSDIRSQLNEVTGTPCPTHPQVLCLKVEDAVKDPRSFGSALQALCRIPVLIVDGSDVTPAMAFLLGLRSVVRRGVTVIFRVGQMNGEAWQRLAFNLREIRFVEISGRSSQAAEKPLAAALEEGLLRYARRPFHYNDLPGFDALRNLGSHEDDTSIKKPEDEILVLCPFDADYETRLWPQIQRALKERFCPNKDSGPARRVLDLDSPETLERRLFQAIRRDSECIVDLTRSKPNVFFELGFRLAAHPRGARIIRCEDFKNPVENQKSASDIEALFSARGYNFGTDPLTSLSSAMCLHTDTWPGGLLSASYTFLVAQRCICAQQEGGGLELLDLLWQAVESIGGKDRQRQATYPVLYVDNPKIRAQTVRFVFQGMLGYLLLAAKILPNHDTSRRRIALAELSGLLEDMKLDPTEKARLTQLINQLENDYES